MPEVVLASDAPPVAASWSGKPRPAASPTAVSHQPVGPLQLLHRPEATHEPDLAGRSRAPSRTRRSSRTAASAASRSARCTARTSTWSDALGRHDVGPACRRARRPTLTVTPGQRPLRAWSATILWAASRIALNDPSRAPRPRAPHDRRCAARGPRCPSGSSRSRRWRGRPPARAPHPRSRRVRADDGRAHGRPDLLVGVGDEDEPAHRQPVGTRALVRPSSRSARSAYSPASRPPFMSETPGPCAMPSSIRNGRSATVPGSNTVSMWPTSSTVGPSESPSPRTPIDGVAVAPRWAPPRPARPARANACGDPRADLVHARLGVAAAVDVHQPLQVGQVGRQLRVEDAGQAARARRG